MTIDFTEQQLAQVLQTLAQRPYAEVFDLMQHIQRQAQAQVAQQGSQARLQPVAAGT